MGPIKTSIKNITHVLRTWQYLSLTIGMAFLFYMFMALVANIKIMLNAFSTINIFHGLSFTWTLLIGYYNTISLFAFMSIIITSVLFGVLVSLLVYKTIALKSLEKKTSGFASLGLFLGILAPGCAACGVGFLSLIGLGGAIILPFQGAELSFLAILILAVSIHNVGKNLYTCRIKTAA